LSEPLCDAARRLIGEGVDWTAVVEMATEHGTYPLASRHCSSTLADVVPAAIQTILRAGAAANARRSDAMTAELAALLQTLERGGVRVVPLKGPVLAERIWGDARLGVCCDLDLLVPPGESRRAVAILTESGYTVDTWGAAEFPQGTVHLVRDHPLGFELLLDLQERAVPYWVGRPEQADGFWERLSTASLRGVRIAQIPDDYMLALLGIHTMRHWFESLRWAAQLYGFMKACPEALAPALDRAAEMGVAREMGLALETAEAIFCEEMLAGKQLHPFVTRLAEGPFRPPDARFVFQFLLAMRRTRREKLRYILTVPFVPRTTDFDILRLPRWLMPAYYVLRPVRLAVRYIGEVVLKPSSSYLFGRLRKNTNHL
jgi:hypothetical protein